MFQWINDLVAYRESIRAHKRALFVADRERQLAVDEQHRQYNADERERQRQHALELRTCNSCSVYRSELDRMHRYNTQLLDALTRKNEPPEPEAQYETKVELKPAFTPWKVRRKILEEEDAKRASVMKADKVVPLTEADLEKEIEAMKNAK